MEGPTVQFGVLISVLSIIWIWYDIDVFPDSHDIIDRFSLVQDNVIEMEENESLISALKC